MKIIIIAIALLLGIFLLGLKFTPDHHEDDHELHLMEKIRKHQAPINYESSTSGTLDTTHLLKMHSDLPNVSDFFTENRTASITSFPCNNCHSQPLTTMQAGRDATERKAHWNIHLVHAHESTMNCTTCHAKNNMNQLATLTGDFLPLDQSFKLCGQCHSTQFKDWQGGAHGKQLNGWKPPRVAKTCVSCHNPHQPSFPKRFPARLNTYETE